MMYNQLKIVLTKYEIQDLLDGNEVTRNEELEWAADPDGNMLLSIEMEIVIVKE